MVKGVAALAWLGLLIACLIGWVLNIVDIVGMATAAEVVTNYTLLIVRIVGIFVFPLGGIMGYF